MLILTFLSVVLLFARPFVEGITVDGANREPFLFPSEELDESPSHDITRWAWQLHLQQCAFVEIGEGFCALFVELRSIPSDANVLDNSGVGEFFLGICPCSTLHSWSLCSAELTSLRKADCTFNEATPYSNTSARVHRRLCDVTLLCENAPACNCSVPLAGQRLYKTKGFPTCFLNPLPESLCSPRGVCGVAQCAAGTIKGIHTPQCSPNCHQKQPFCEEIGPSTSIAPEIDSSWSRWSSPKCNNTCGRGFLVAVASCQDQRETSDRLHRAGIILVRQCSLADVPLNSFTMTKGVNFSSCPDSFGKCYCEVNIVDGFMRAIRFTEPCISTEGCTPSHVGTFTFEGELDPAGSLDFDEAYENDDRERSEDALYSFESSRTMQRHLLQARSYEQEDEPYGLRENSPVNENVKGVHGYRSVRRSQLDDGSVGNDQEYDDDDDEDWSDEEEDFGDEENDEADEYNGESANEMIGLRGSVKGRRSPRKRTREAVSDYAAIALEGRQGVDELGDRASREEPSTAEVNEECTEPLQYYDYEPPVTASSDLRAGHVLPIIIVSLLVL